jgi:hypothetical protein
MRIKIAFPFIIAVITACLFSPAAMAAKIIAGPMLGHVTESTAKVWARVSGPVNLSAEAVQNTGRVPGKRMDVGFDFVVFEFEGLNPGSPVHVTVNA